MSNTLVQTIESALLPQADAKRANGMKAYMRGQFEFLGIPTPLRRFATADLLRTKATSAELLSTAIALWKLPQREFQYVAVDLLTRQWKTLTPANLPALLGLIQECSWWDSVDGLAKVIGNVVKAARIGNPREQESMDAALCHDNLWVRRIAMLHQLGWKMDTDSQRLFAYALKLAPERDFFIRKAVGWALRDYAKHNPDTVIQFLNTYSEALSPLSVREAAKHLPMVP
jgi:3-methyladenine DNA glycosylase AlkD